MLVARMVLSVALWLHLVSSPPRADPQKRRVRHVASAVSSPANLILAADPKFRCVPDSRHGSPYHGVGSTGQVVDTRLSRDVSGIRSCYELDKGVLWWFRERGI